MVYARLAYRAGATALRQPRAISPITLAAQQSRSVSVYGYEQAKCLAFPDYGEPKDVLRLHGHSISAPHGKLVTLRFLASPINPNVRT